jgi:hypothetical protein
MGKSKEARDLGVNYKKGMPSDQHWQVKVPATAEGFGDDPAGAFLPRPGKDRAQPHQKINECDH